MSRLHALLPLLAAVLLAGCAASRPATPRGAVAASGAERALRAEVDAWYGTPHRLGGTTRQGVDCSAFVQHVYADALGLALPRTTRDQLRVGRRVRSGAYQPGDLVFFRNPDKSYHVGVYLSGDEFAHASSSRGVMISRLGERYWQEAYLEARRLRPAPAPADRTAAVPAPPGADPRPLPRRTGW